MKKTGNHKNRIGCMILLCLLLSSVFSGCGRIRVTEGTGLYFDTVVDIKIYDRRGDKLLADCFALCEEMEQVLSAQKEGSELWNLNHRTAQTVDVSEDLAYCISQGLFYGELSDGAFDITILPLRELWNFEEKQKEETGTEAEEGTAESRIPSEDSIREALQNVDYRTVHVNGNTVSFDDPDVQIDLGGIAKGYISQKIKAYLASEGCTSALINLGGNVSALGTKIDGTKWVVGIQEPFADRGTVRETVELADGSVISSGTYERYFTENGIRYHHILDPHTGYPVRTTVQQATVIGDDDVRGDAFSTICVLLGEQEARRIMDTYEWKMELRFVNEASP